MLVKSVLAAAGALLAQQDPEASNAVGYSWNTEWFSAWVDNFNSWGPTSGSTYQQRYLINDTFWGGGPDDCIAFYTGNEGDITLFAANTGLVWEVAQEQNCLVVFAEHRYYGASLPFGADSYDNDNLGFLSSEQALADYSNLLGSLKGNLSIPDAPVIAFGGSYGGMLAAWFRMKYPGVVAGSIAASAPVLQFTGLTDPTVYNGIVTRTFGKTNPNAPPAIFSSWGVMTDLANTQDGRDFVREYLGICDTLAVPTDVTNTVFNWLNNAIGYAAMADYNVPANFLGPMPAYPVTVMTQGFSGPNVTPDILLSQLRAIPQVFYNYTGQAGSCFNLSALMPPGLTGDGWNVQSCMEMVMPVGQYGWPTDMFYAQPWSLAQDIAGCVQSFNTTPRPYMTQTIYSSDKLAAASNIVFSNGDLDPWSGGGILKNITGNPSIIAITVKGGAHHSDLRPSDPSDFPSLIEVRSVEKAAIRRWIAEHNAATKAAGVKAEL